MLTLINFNLAVWIEPECSLDGELIEILLILFLKLRDFVFRCLLKLCHTLRGQRVFFNLGHIGPGDEIPLNLRSKAALEEVSDLTK